LTFTLRHVGVECGGAAPVGDLSEKLLHPFRVRNGLAEHDPAGLGDGVPGPEQGFDDGFVSLGQEQSAIQFFDRVLVLTGVLDSVPVDVVDEESVVDGGQVAAPHSLLDAELVAGGTEARLDVVVVAAPRGCGDPELRGRV